MTERAARPSLFLKHFHRLPRFIWRGLFIFEGAIQIHFGQEIVRIKFQEPRKENLGVSKITRTEFLQTLFVRFEPLQKFWIDLLVSSADESKNVHRFAFTFHLHAGNGAKMNLVTRQFSRWGADKNIHAINSRETLEPRRQINRVADDRGVHPL